GIISSEEMNVVDENCEYLGVRRLMMMENAGAAVAKHVASFFDNIEKRRILVLCGSGNNGGDGMVAARHLACMGADVTVLLLAEPGKIRSEEARINYESVKNMKTSINFRVVDTVEKLMNHADVFDEADAVVDAILGTGAKGGLSELFKTAVNFANNSKGVKIAVDIPTGLNPDTGEGETYFQPELVVALHRPKPVHEKIKEKTVVEKIGIPTETELLAGPGQLKLLLRKVGVAKVLSGRLAYVFGESGPDEKVRDLLTSLKGFTVFCNINMLVENPEVRYSFSSSRAVLVSGDVNPSSIKPFLPRSQPVVLTTPSASMVNPIYVLWSDKPLLESFRTNHQSYIKDVDELCRKLAAPVYVVGEIDIMSNGVKTWCNWLGKPVKQSYFGYVAALVAWFVASGADAILSMASTSYLIRYADAYQLESPSTLGEFVLKTIEKLA
ncbi:MAG: NAD(P)H-hydrate epimerase, partial [Candidatus Caldarchaeum sp.]